MVVSRTSASLGRTILRRAATQSRTHAWRQTARRYASTGTASAEKAKKTSDIPWMIGSVAFTVPAAVWLLGQGPEKSDHGHASSHDEDGEAKEEEAPAEESTDEKPEESSEEKSEDSSDKDEEEPSEGEDKEPKEEDKKSEGEDKKSEGEDKKSEDSSSEDSDGEDKKDTPDTSEDEGGEDKPSPGSPGQINYKSSMEKGPGELQKGPRKRSETSGEKNAAGDKSGAQNPYLDDDEKSKKGEGLKDTQRIHGTVDSNRPLR